VWLRIKNETKKHRRNHEVNAADFKGWVHSFSMQVVMNTCFLLNPEKNLAQVRLVVFEKNAKTYL